MPLLEYPYIKFPDDSTSRPIAFAFAINTLNGQYAEFLGIVDSGADQTTLAKDLLEDLGIDPGDLPVIRIDGAEGPTYALSCDFIKIGFIQKKPQKILHYPNGPDVVPLHFANGPFNLLGRESFLDLCRIFLDGPNKMVTVDI